VLYGATPNEKRVGLGVGIILAMVSHLLSSRSLGTEPAALGIVLSQVAGAVLGYLTVGAVWADTTRVRRPDAR
jgi:tetrahydromethanopterin S-methyltransferase subunit C